jgi:serine/threonine protein phosphatase 1
MNRLIAISDIHGCFDTFHELVINILKLSRSDKLILLGDYIDRGEKSREVIEFINDLLAMNYDLTTLLGNHEWMLLETYKNAQSLPLWLINSGMTTMKSFGINNIEDIKTSYIDFFMNLKYYETVGDYIFVHGGFNDNAENPFTDIHGMIWECHKSYSHPALSGKTIIHGHRPKTREFVERVISDGARVIPIDTGCVYEKELGYGYLSALEVNTMTLFSAERI